jgi:xylan 1,4-beta-xylosidase
LVVAVWNLVPPDQTGSAKSVVLRFSHIGSARHAAISRVDREHGDPHPAYEKMGSPVYPTRAQLQKLRDAVEIGPPEIQELKRGELSVTLPPDGLAVIAIR